MLHHVGVPHFFHQGMASKTTSWGQSFGAGKSQIPRIFGGENGKICDGWITWKWWEDQVLAQFQVNRGVLISFFVIQFVSCLLICGQGQEMRIVLKEGIFWVTWKKGELQECTIPILPCPYQSLNLGRRNDSADGETNFAGDPR